MVASSPGTGWVSIHSMPFSPLGGIGAEKVELATGILDQLFPLTDVTIVLKIDIER